MTTNELDSKIHDNKFSSFDDDLIEKYFNDDGKKAIQAHTAKAVKEAAMIEDYLSHFQYSDYEVGDDTTLRLGDYINCNHQRAYDGYEQNFEGQIVEHHHNKLPVVIYNVELEDPDNSGEYADLQSLMMNGWEFIRIKELQEGKQ